ncbi:AAA family ATPase [Methylocystis parvus]|uniref:AAA family ATPase n=1 Tax=Methylocystis parvus TaxID=134 RepID=A0A6B8MAX7_9HYPH|nr:AAA family ATPase [Methylocystis parvus]QGM98433.1 AAA family ATPase [Methylocystis parvus]WBK01232.1 AAA family ATPase [Methylocystis parvus OBBP]
MTAPALTSHQQGALCDVLRLLETERVVALRGLAGTGKTALIPHLADALGKVTVVAMTNKAAEVLRAKGEARAHHAEPRHPIL